MVVSRNIKQPHIRNANVIRSVKSRSVSWNVIRKLQHRLGMPSAARLLRFLLPLKTQQTLTKTTKHKHSLLQRTVAKPNYLLQKRTEFKSNQVFIVGALIRPSSADLYIPRVGSVSSFLNEGEQSPQLFRKKPQINKNTTQPTEKTYTYEGYSQKHALRTFLRNISFSRITALDTQAHVAALDVNPLKSKCRFWVRTPSLLLKQRLSGWGPQKPYTFLNSVRFVPRNHSSIFNRTQLFKLLPARKYRREERRERVREKKLLWDYNSRPVQSRAKKLSNKFRADVKNSLLTLNTFPDTNWSGLREYLPSNQIENRQTRIQLTTHKASVRRRFNCRQKKTPERSIFYKTNYTAHIGGLLNKNTKCTFKYQSSRRKYGVASLGFFQLTKGFELTSCKRFKLRKPTGYYKNRRATKHTSKPKKHIVTRRITFATTPSSKLRLTSLPRKSRRKTAVGRVFRGDLKRTNASVLDYWEEVDDEGSGQVNAPLEHQKLTPNSFILGADLIGWDDLINTTLTPGVVWSLVHDFEDDDTAVSSTEEDWLSDDDLIEVSDQQQVPKQNTSISYERPTSTLKQNLKQTAQTTSDLNLFLRKNHQSIFANRSHMLMKFPMNSRNAVGFILKTSSMFLAHKLFVHKFPHLRLKFVFKKKLFSFLFPNQVKKAIMNRRRRVVVYRYVSDFRRRFKKRKAFSHYFFKKNLKGLSLLNLSNTSSSGTHVLTSDLFREQQSTHLPGSYKLPAGTSLDTEARDNRGPDYSFKYERREVRIPRIRFKPGYQRIWRRARSAIQENLGLKLCYQQRLTKYLAKFTKHTTYYSFSTSEMAIGRMFVYARLLPDLHTVNAFHESNLIYLNGRSHPFLDLTAVPNDVLQVMVSMRYYVVHRWLSNWTLQRHRRTRRLIYRKGLAFRHRLMKTRKQPSHYTPSWIHNARFDTSDTKPFLEVDFFTLSALVLYEPYHFFYYTPDDTIDLRLITYRLYNWKYIN